MKDHFGLLVLKDVANDIPPHFLLIIDGINRLIIQNDDFFEFDLCSPITIKDL